MVKDHTKAREETRCCHMGYSFRLAARVLLYASSHRQDNTYHSLCNTSCGALAGTRNSWYKVILLIIKFWFAIILILHVLILYVTFLFHSHYTTPSLFFKWFLFQNYPKLHNQISNFLWYYFPISSNTNSCVFLLFWNLHTGDWVISSFSNFQ